MSKPGPLPSQHAARGTRLQSRHGSGTVEREGQDDFPLADGHMGLANQRQCARLPNVERSALCTFQARLSTDFCTT